MIVIGIDIALRNEGICVLKDGVIVFHQRFVPKADNFWHPQFLLEHESFLLSLLNRHKPDLVAIEGVSVASSNWQTSIGALFGLYTLTTFKRELPTVILPPMKWKKIFTSRGDASKSLIRQVAQNNFVYTPAKGRKVSQDEYDATGIAFVGWLAGRLVQGQTLKLDAQLLKLFNGDKGILKDSFLNFNLGNLSKFN